MAQEATTALEGRSGKTPSVPIAVFDFDGTVINAQSGTQFTKYLLLKHYIGPAIAFKVMWWGLRYTLHLPIDQDRVRFYLTDNLRSYSKAQVYAIMKDFHDRVLVRHYRQDALRQLKDCREDGCVCVLVSATFQGVADAAKDYAGFDAALATQMEWDAQGHLTGNVSGSVVEGAGKVAALQAWANARFGRDGWHVEYAFGDHYTDKPMLSLAERPFAVDPGKTLKRAAQALGWPVLLWR